MPAGVWLMLVLMVLAAIGGMVQAHHKLRRQAVGPASSKAGWIYFITAPSREDSPVKIGMTSKDPVDDRLPDLRTMSPFPLRIIFKMQVTDRFAAEAAIHEELAEWRLHGEWFDRDAALMYIEHLKGEQ